MECKPLQITVRTLMTACALLMALPAMPALADAPFDSGVVFDDEGNPAPPSPEAIPRDDLVKTHHGYYLTAREAHDVKAQLGDAVLFIDVRDTETASRGGTPKNADLQIPAMRRLDNGRLQVANGFVGKVKKTLAARGQNLDTPIFLICENGRQSATAAELLAQSGLTRVFVVRGGISGELANAEPAGWRAAQLATK